MTRCLTFILLLTTTCEASAHAFAQRYDLPLPLWHYIVGAGATVAVSLVVAAIFMRSGAHRREERRLQIPDGLAGIAEFALRALGTGCFAALLVAGFFGEQGDWDSNILPVTVWVIWWVGLAFVSALLVDLWPLIDPWSAIGRLALPNRTGPAFHKARNLGHLPALIFFLAFSLAELAWTENAVPRKLATVILLWSLVAWTGMATVGVEAWRKYCDPFANFFALFGRFAPVTARRDTNAVGIFLRPWGAGLAARQTPSTSFVAFILLTLGTVAFDGISETPFWEGVSGLLIGLLYESGVVNAIGYAASGALVKTMGLVATPVVFGAIYLATSAFAGYLSGESGMLTARRYGCTLAPIAIAYHLAHYLSYLLIQGQAILPLLGDPFGLGWNLFGWRNRQIDIAVVDAGFIWLSAVASIVAGHVIAVVLAHREALRTAPPHRATLNLAPLSALMIGYTMLSLWILSQPIVEIN